MSLAIFDLDNTLLGGDSDHAWGEFLVAVGEVNEQTYREANDHFYRQYQQGNLDMNEYLAFSLEPLKRIAPERLATLHQQFMNEIIEPMVLPKAEALVRDHSRQGHTLLIITATNRFITAPIAKRLQIPNLLATEAEMEAGRYTGKPTGIPCFQEGKVKRLATWLKEHNISLAESWFYSDSANDIPLLEEVSHPIAVDPDERLSKYADQKGWEVVSLR